MTRSLSGRLIAYLETVISEKRRGFPASIVRLALLPISWVVRAATKSRRLLYSRGVLRTRHLPCKVISVGNIVAGGAGKTPAVMLVADVIRQQMGLSVAILSRGYGGEARGPAVVSDGRNILMDPKAAGDEPYLLGRNLEGVPILIGKDRLETGLLAIRRWNCRVAVLDDGFQYLRLGRDVNIVVVDATKPFGLGHLLPRGYLREPVSALAYADLIILTRTDQCDDIVSVRHRLFEIAPSVPVFESVHDPDTLSLLGTDRELELDFLRGKKVLAVCGIANPVSFARTLESLEASDVNLLAFPDHYEFPPVSIRLIKRKLAEAEADVVVTTEKDAVKLEGILDLPVLSLSVKLRLVGPEAEQFAEVLTKRIC